MNMAPTVSKYKIDELKPLKEINEQRTDMNMAQTVSKCETD